MREGEGLAVAINPAGSADRHLQQRSCDPSSDYTQQLFADGQGRSGPKTRGKRSWQQADFAVTGGAGWRRNGSSIASHRHGTSAMPAMLRATAGLRIRYEWLISRNLIIPWLNVELPA